MTVTTETQFVANSDIPRAWWKSAVVYQVSVETLDGGQSRC